MKISKLFHWLYFFVMALPLLAIPIFAIYSHRHTIDSYSAVNSESVNLNAFQYIKNGLPNSLDTWFDDDSNVEFHDNYFEFTYYDTLYTNYEFTLSKDSIYFVCFDYLFEAEPSSSTSIYLGIYGDEALIETPYSNTYQRAYITYSDDTMDYFDNIYLFYTGEAPVYHLYIKNIMFFDLTEIFGQGNEISGSDFNNYLIQDYYDYGNHIISFGYHDVTYNDTDIGSQFTYDVYNVIDKYFNYDRVFNFGDLYTWLNTTFFSGQAPLGFFIFWHLLIYWLLTSILWLVFDVLMYVPQLVHRWLDKASIS